MCTLSAKTYKHKISVYIKCQDVQTYNKCVHYVPGVQTYKKWEGLEGNSEQVSLESSAAAGE